MLIPSCGRLYYLSRHIIGRPVPNKIMPELIPLAYLLTSSILLILFLGRQGQHTFHQLSLVRVRAPQNIADIEQQLVNVWRNVSQDDIRNLIALCRDVYKHVSPPGVILPTSDLNFKAVIGSPRGTLWS
ncbi:hypothetical protein TNCV_1103781 [Trichonephila clavipes]|nr:hypothetical protein TNCV_1103781 [Trichonephila clavipes]